MDQLIWLSTLSDMKSERQSERDETLEREREQKQINEQWENKTERDRVKATVGKRKKKKAQRIGVKQM